jgi:predicted DNA-binding protein (UPF0251 family)
MSAASTIDPISIERLRKIWALASSPNVGEATAARDRASAFLARHGKTVADIPDLLATKPKASEPAQGPFGFTFYDMNNPDHMAAYADIDRSRRAERARKEKPQRDAVIEAYGSANAVIAPCEREIQLRDAVRQWSVPREPPHQRWTERIGEWDDSISDIPQHVREALSAAYALPTTIEDAAAEYAYWERRDREMGLVLEDTSDTQLDLAAYGRKEIVRGLLETGLRAKSLADVLARQRHLVDCEYSMPEADRAVLADLEYLTEMAPEDTVQNGQVKMTASDRRAEVIRLLSNVDMTNLSDREIARKVGVSPQTVGNIRRKHATATTG